MTQMRRSDWIQVGLVLSAIVFLVGVLLSNYLFAQTPEQAFINATLGERIAAIGTRLDRVENYTTAAILALIANLVATTVQIRSLSRPRNRRTEAEE